MQTSKVNNDCEEAAHPVRNDCLDRRCSRVGIIVVGLVLVAGIIIGSVLGIYVVLRKNDSEGVAGSSQCGNTLFLTNGQYHARLAVCSSVANEDTDVLNSKQTFPQVKRAFIVVHGTGYDPAHHHKNMKAATEASGKKEETLILAPYFPKTSAPSRVLSKHPSPWLVWNDNNYDKGWKGGGYSLGPPGAVDDGRRLVASSFEVLDVLLLELTNCTKYPNLKYITITGNSGGGFLVDRYSAYSWLLEQLNTQRYYSMQLVPVAAAFFTYYDTRRAVQRTPSLEGAYQFAPVNSSSCRDFDNWPLGTQQLHGSMHGISSSTIIGRQRHLVRTYIMGSGDTEPRYDGCEMLLQGENRVQKQRIYEAYVRMFFGDDYVTQGNATFVVVPGYGHESRVMESSPAVDVYFNNRFVPPQLLSCSSGRPPVSSTYMQLRKYIP
mmetsp:Transcript_38127/g.84969  ORF Transcript_38127/g.84969 Transcript_38127/m.84969 type:complete len:435 (+) Transcript_38127:183-1487(+)